MQRLYEFYAPIPGDRLRNRLNPVAIQIVEFTLNTQ
jgi:hypothetical protein